MRIAKSLQEERKTVVLDLLTANPKMTIRAVNEALKAKYGKAMHPREIQGVRSRVLLKGGLTVTDPIEAVAALNVVADHVAGN